MKKFSISLFALVAALAITPYALATSITGSIAIDGYNQTWSATGVSFLTLAATAGNATGDLGTVIPGAVSGTVTATMDVSNITFATPDVLVWTIDTNTATFAITGPLDVQVDTGGFLNITGTGTLTLTGYDATPAYLSFSATDSGGDYGIGNVSSNYIFDVNTQPPPPTVPEPGTLSMFGAGLLGLAGMLRSRFSKAS
jgi:hypothetical protein